jgi:hypothetical protein
MFPSLHNAVALRARKLMRESLKIDKLIDDPIQGATAAGRMSSTAARISFGERPNQRRKARENALGSDEPNRKAMSVRLSSGSSR